MIKCLLLGKRNAQVWVSALLYLLISIVVLTLILVAGIPLIKNMGDKAYFDKTKNEFSSIDKVIKDVAVEGEGSQRVIPLEIKKGKLIVGDNKLLWWFKTNADILSHKTKVEEGNVITLSGIDVDCYETKNSYIIENSHILVNFTKKLKVNGTLQPLNSSELINLIKWKHSNKTVPGFFTFVVNNDPNTTIGYGRTEVNNCGTKKEYVEFEAYFYYVNASIDGYSGNFSYKIIIKLDANSDYITPKLVLI